MMLSFLGYVFLTSAQWNKGHVELEIVYFCKSFDSCMSAFALESCNVMSALANISATLHFI